MITTVAITADMTAQRKRLSVVGFLNKGSSRPSRRRQIARIIVATTNIQTAVQMTVTSMIS